MEMSEMKNGMMVLGIIAGASAFAGAQTVVSTYDDVTEGFKGSSWTYNGITYSNVNNRDGVYADGTPFASGDNGDQVIVENATLLYNDFPAWGSANNALTFGTSFIPGSNLTIGALVTVDMDLGGVANTASMEIAYYENGPWIGIEYHLDAYRNGALVGGDVLTIGGTDPNARDNIAFNTLSFDGGEFDSLVFYATLNGEYTAPRAFVDDLTVNYIPAPGALAVLGLGGVVARRRR